MSSSSIPDSSPRQPLLPSSKNTYQTHPLSPSHSSPSSTSISSSTSYSTHTPLPYTQLFILFLLSISEQTTLNSLTPYLPAMLSSFPSITPDTLPVSLGILASAFALAQLFSSYLWGALSDHVGRKPVLLLGSLGLLVSIVAFGFSTTFPQAVAFQTLMGLLNGNAAVFPTVLGELTDRSNQSRVFTWLPIVYSLGSITGPAMGGFFAGKFSSRYPYAAPNIVSAIILATTIVAVSVFFKEPKTKWPQKRRSIIGILPYHVQRLLWGHIPSYHHHSGATASSSSRPTKPLWTKTTILLLASYFIFQLANVVFQTLYPIFTAAAPPAGRQLPPTTIGLLLSIAGVATMLFQATVFESIKCEYGNIRTYRFAISGIAACFALMPCVGYLDPPASPAVEKGPIVWRNVATYSEITAILIARNIFVVGGLSCVLLLINNSATPSTLGTLNGAAQSLSAAGRAVGPLIAGSIFSFAINRDPKGSIIAFGVFAVVSAVGWLGSLGIVCPELESDDYIESRRQSGETRPK